ncbi:MAG TPA: glycosyl transferase family 2 [Opitutaceae bacterium]|nr:glycosyl transferase family 2 [Opitutaceae bacterium]
MHTADKPALTPGRMVYLGLHRPLEVIKRTFADGGPLAQRETARWQERMIAAAGTITIPQAPAGAPKFAVHFLTGTRFWYQTVFCAASIARHGGIRLACHIHDDGSLDDALTARLTTALGPDTVIHTHAESVARLDVLLPESRFPQLRERHRNYPNIRKLIDPHLGSTGWKCVLDSDMLFFRRPTVLLNWLRAPDRPSHMVDCETSYGYPITLLSKLCGASVEERVNVGICGLDSASLDWERLEHWCARLHAVHGTSYFLEQALVAMLVAGRPCEVAPAADYVCLPARGEVEAPAAVMHHYVAGSKRWYFRHGWRNCGVAPATQ